MKTIRHDRVCDICGDYKGIHFDHAECSEARKSIFESSGENKHPHKKRTIKELDNAAIYFRDNSL